MKNSTTYLCFIGTILLGLGFLVVGLVLIPALPMFELDAVLTEDELKDAALSESTLAMLRKASGNQWLVWVIGGAAQVGIGVIGLMADKTPTSAELPPAF